MRTVLIALLLVTTSTAHALETISSTTLIAMCQSKQETKLSSCKGYLTGFLDGAFATDPSVGENIVREMQQEESFSERATRTRMGVAMERFGPSYYAGFCIGPETTVANILQQLQHSPRQQARTIGQNARDFLYQFLRERYPCQ